MAIHDKEGAPMQFVKVEYLKSLELERAKAISEMAVVMEKNFALQDKIEKLEAQALFTRQGTVL